MNVDQGTQFGTWKDPVSRFMYTDSTREILSVVKIPRSVGDLGGGNGLIKQFIPHAITVDIDALKQPDVVADILNHSTRYELVILRYVLHYLNDYEVIRLFNTIRADNILIIQFTNEDLIRKYNNSINETKYFRTQHQLEALIGTAKQVYNKTYVVTKEFYSNRLNNSNGVEHQETLRAYYI